MSGRMSYRDRIAHLRAEADAAAKEKEAARAAKSGQPRSPRKSAAAAAPKGRVRIVWNVCDQSGKPVAQFPYAQEQEAIADAAERTASSGRTHFVGKGEVPVE